jgi:hypothetical protein
MATTQTEHDLIHNDPDWINLKRFNNSLKELLVRYPDGAPDHVVAAGLNIDETEVDVLYNQIVLKLRQSMGVAL